jgi:hypothetical protein
VDQQRTRRTQRRISVSQMLARIRQHIAAVDTQGGNRMRESCTYGSVRGVRGNSHPYRDEGASEAGAISRCKSGPGYAFDLIELDGEDLRPAPLDQRKGRRLLWSSGRVRPG